MHIIGPAFILSAGLILSGSVVAQTNSENRAISINSNSSATTVISMRLDGGTYVVPVLINNAITLDFIVDSGASDVSIPADVVSTLLRTGTIDKTDFIGTQTYQLADGTSVPSVRFRVRSLRVGNAVLQNVVAGLAPAKGNLLLGQSFLSRFSSWSIDNGRHQLLLSTCCQQSTSGLVTVGLPQTDLSVRPSMPLEGTSSTTLSSWSQRRDVARQFILALYHQMSAPNDVAANVLSDIYADNVNYFGKDTSREQVIQSELKFLARWPIRTYRPKDGVVIVNCEETTLSCSASGVLQFDARNLDRNQRSIGEATFQYHLQFSSRSEQPPKVVAENGIVLKRELQMLYPQADRSFSSQ